MSNQCETFVSIYTWRGLDGFVHIYVHVMQQTNTIEFSKFFSGVQMEDICIHKNVNESNDDKNIHIKRI